MRDYDVIFNVDLLHPTQPREPGSLKEPRIRPEMFVDHVELAFPISDWLRKNFHGVSIAAPHSAFIFKESAHEQFPLETVLPSGQTCVVNVPLMNEVALLVTKSESIASPKRPRDSFDVYLTIRQCRDRERLVVDLDRLRRRDVVVFNSLLGIRNFVKKDPPTFGHSVETYLPVEQRNPELSYLSPRRDPYAEEVLALLDEVGAP